MSTSFPSGLDSLSNPASTDTLNSPSHSAQHADANDAIEALETKVGIDGSSVSTSHDKRITDLRALTYPASTFTAGDILYASSATQLTKLAKGSANQNLKMDSSGALPSWVSLDGCKVYNAGAHSFADGVALQLTFDTEAFDDNTMHSTSSQTTRITIKKTGRYSIVGQIGFTGNDSLGTRNAALKVNGSNLAITHISFSGGGSLTSVPISCIENLQINDYIELQGTCTGTTANDVAGLANTFLVVQQIF